MEQIRVQINFSQETEFGTFSDALYLSLQEYFETSPEQIEVMKQERVDNWVNLLKNPPQEEPTQDEVTGG